MYRSSGKPDTSVCSCTGLPSDWYDIRRRILSVACTVKECAMNYPVGDVGLVRLPSPLPSGEPSPGSIAGIVVGIVVGDRLEFSRLSSPPKEEELASRFGPPVPFLMLLSFRLFKSSPIPPSTGVLAPSDELTAAGGVLAGISRLPSRSSRS
uniref:Uncharacterized protein n=1 Tax=Anopheles coluzzii TaxID=1518534 RepID=A0A8W7PDZ1_ANOCL